MGASIRDIANINLFPFSLPIFNLIKFNNISEDINMDALRGRFTIPSPNSSRKLFTYSNISSQVYTNKIEAENKKLN